MVITDTGEMFATCMWFADDEYAHTQVFPVACLTNVSDVRKRTSMASGSLLCGMRGR